MPESTEVAVHAKSSSDGPAAEMDGAAKSDITVSAQPEQPDKSLSRESTPTVQSTESSVVSGSDPTSPVSPDATIAYLRDGQKPLDERRGYIARLATRKDPAAWRTLREIADADIYLSHVAIKAMYGVKCASKKEIATYLEGKLLSPDPRVARAAIDVYARTLGTEAVKTICDAVEKGRKTDHAFFDHVAEAGYSSLGALASPEAVDFLAAESLKVGKDLDMGSTIVKALSNIAVPEAREAIVKYADDLAGRLPEKPMERAYFEKKIAEARALAERMGS